MKKSISKGFLKTSPYRDLYIIKKKIQNVNKCIDYVK